MLHGLRARTPLLDGEDREAFVTLRDGAWQHWKPVGVVEQSAVDRWVSANWSLRRLAAVEAGLLTDADVPLPDLLKTVEVTSTINRQTIDQMFKMLSTEGLADKLTGFELGLDSKAIEDIGVQGEARHGEVGKAELRRQLKDTVQQLSASPGGAGPGGEAAKSPSRRGDATVSAPAPPLKDVDVEGWARSFSRNERSFATLARYKTTLENSCYRASHELERLQAARAGAVVPPPVVLDIGLTASNGQS